MDWNRVGWIGLVLVASCFLSDASGQGQGLGEVVDRQDTPAQAVTGDVDPAAVSPTGLAALDLNQRIAQLMFITLEGKLAPSRKDMTVLSSYPPGGVIILGTSQPSVGAKYVSDLRALAIERSIGLPMFIATDSYALSHGDRARTKAFAELPSMLSMAAANNPALTRALASEIAREMTTMGFNLHIGPSLALDSGALNGAGSIHQFGSDPEITASTSGSLFSAFEENDLLWAPMGFPGGEARRTTRGPAILITSAKHLATQDLLPYARAIEAGAQIIHVGNTLVTTEREGIIPACLSETVMQDWLRDDLGFKGIILAGPMDGDVIRASMDTTDAAHYALMAGADMLLWRDSGASVLKAVQGLSISIQKKDFDEGIVNAALKRQVTLKEERGLLAKALPDEKEARKIERKIAKFEEPYLLERHSITLVQNRGNVLPLDEELSMPLGVTGAIGVDELEKVLSEHIKLVGSYKLNNAKRIGRIQDFEISRLLKNAMGTQTAVCIFTGGEDLRGQLQIIRAFKQLGSRVVVVYVGYPDRVVELSEADALVLAYSNPASVSKVMNAVADVLLGSGPIEILPAKSDLKRTVNEEIPFDVAEVVRSPVGRLPVTIEGKFVAGYSVSYAPQLALKKVLWDFGDGKHSNESRGIHAFREPGRYTVQLTVTDNMGSETSGEFHVSIE